MKPRKKPNYKNSPTFANILAHRKAAELKRRTDAAQMLQDNFSTLMSSCVKKNDEYLAQYWAKKTNYV